MSIRSCFVILWLSAVLPFALLHAQPNSGSIQGTVTDPSGAIVAGATVQLQDPATGYKQTAATDTKGQFQFNNVPFNPYHIEVTAQGFQPAKQDVLVRSAVPVQVSISLGIAATAETVNVEAEAADVVENVPTQHTDISLATIATLPVQTSSSGVSSVITQSTAGVVAESNGMFHPLGEHADTSYSIDNQPVTDQQSRTFSNQLPLETVQSMEVISGVPPAEFGDKTSLVVRTTTKSGLGLARPTGSVVLDYGSFGTPSASITLGTGGKTIGNFIAANGLQTGRFLDSPEFTPVHDKGNSESIFDRLDYQARQADTLHLNLSASRSWFQIPNTYDQQFAGQDQRQLVRSFNIAPGYTHLFNTTTLFSATAYVRQDRVGYSPSNDPVSDQPATFSETRRLTNAGVQANVSYVKGRHNAKAGVLFQHTFLSENFRFGVTDPSLNPVCMAQNGTAVTDPAFTAPAQCVPAGFLVNAGFQPGLLPFDLTRGGTDFRFRGGTDIKQEAVYVQDTISLGQLSASIGVRGDNYNGLSSGSAAEPRVGLSYFVKGTNTVLRASYGRLFETPYNENLVISSVTGAGGLANRVFGAFGARPLKPGIRNQFNVGFQQGIGKRAIIDAEYFWKFTNPDFDFDSLFNTPLTFPIEWRKSKIDGLSVRVTIPEYHGFTGYTALGHTRARFFAPENGGIIFNSPLSSSVFRIDHDEALEQSTHLQYQVKQRGPWFAFTWRYDSGEVAGSVPDFASALQLTGDQQAAIGLFCGNVFATVAAPLTNCSSPVFGATHVVIPAAGTENDDRNPPRIAPRHLFDIGTGIDNLLHTDRYHLLLRFNVINLTNKVALYNFLSTFSGTHFVTPRSYEASLGVSF